MVSLEYNVKVNFQLQAVQHIAHSSASCDAYSHQCHLLPAGQGTASVKTCCNLASSTLLMSPTGSWKPYSLMTKI